jgi:hypothetical protein
MEPMNNERAVSYVTWRDLFVLIDTGHATGPEYKPVCEAIMAQSGKYPDGIGCLTIIPQDAVRPSDEARRMINQAIGSVEQNLRCLCWLVEGTGFQAATARAILTGIRMFGHQQYATHVSSSLQQALAWVLPHLEGGSSRLAEVPAAVAAVSAGRGRAMRPLVEVRT